MPGKSKKILIAEDERPLSKALELKLTNEGYEALTAFNGNEALKILEKNKADLILLDLIMPEKDGFGVLEALHKKGNKTPIIVLTNLSQEQDRDKAKKYGAKNFFVKSDAPISEIVKYVKEFV